MDELLSHARLQREGWTRGQVRRAEADGRLERVRRGQWLAPAPDAPQVDHRVRLAAALAEAAPLTAASHVSAALLWRLPLRDPVPVVWLTRDGHGGGHDRTGVHTVLAALDETDVCQVDGFRATSLARTVVDVARTRDRVESVMVADAALHLGLDRADLLRVVDGMRRWPGIAGARRVVEFADGRSESPYESWTRVRIADMGLPAPVLQHEVHTPSGRFVARVDLALPEHRLAIEYDGEAKYDELVRGRMTPGEAFAREKRRDRALQAEGWTVLHLSKREVHDERLFRQTMVQALGWSRRPAA